MRRNNKDGEFLAPTPADNARQVKVANLWIRLFAAKRRTRGQAPLTFDVAAMHCDLWARQCRITVPDPGVVRRALKRRSKGRNDPSGLTFHRLTLREGGLS